MPNQFAKLDWQVQTLRVTAFPIDVPRMDEGWWDKLIPEPPEARVSRPKQGINEENGPFENGKLILRTQPARIDWIYTVDSEKSQGLSNLGSFYSTEYSFFDVVRKWLTIYYNIKRLAFGPILLYPVPNIIEGYRLISNYLPFVELDLVNSSDFFYQINRPRMSRVSPPLMINRLSKWSVAKMQLFKIELSGLEKAQPTILEASYACRLELDINNSPEGIDQLLIEKLVPLFDELYSIANEISLDGDIK